MFVGSKLQFEVPDNCDGCSMKELEQGYQGSLCTRCPVFNCKDMGSPYGRILRCEDYRDDWAKEFVKFFKTGERPVLLFSINKDEK